jgi:hypothetical protein
VPRKAKYLAILMMTSCSSSPPRVIVQTKPLPPVLATQCPPVPAPINNSCDATAIALKNLYDSYGLCAGRYAELIKNQQAYNNQR